MDLTLSKTNLGINLNPEKRKLVSSMRYTFLDEKLSEVSLSGTLSLVWPARANEGTGLGKTVYSFT